MRKWFYLPIRQLRRNRRSNIASGGILFFLLFIVCLSLILAECSYLGSLSSDFTGQHYAVFYRMTESQYHALCELDSAKKATIYACPVYAVVEEIDSSTVALYVTTYTEEAQAYFGLQTDRAIEEKFCLMPEWLYNKENYYRLNESNEFFLHGTDNTRTIVRSLSLTHVYNSNNARIPYLFVDDATAALWQRDTSGKQLYNVYVQTDLPSDYALALLIDDVCASTGWNNPEQQIQDSYTRRERYKAFINYDYLDLVNHDICTESSFFILVLPITLAAALLLTELFRVDTEEHIGEYAVCKACGAQTETLIGMVMMRIALLTAVVILPVIGCASLIATGYIHTINQNLTEVSLPLRFGVPIDAMCWVLLLFLALSGLFLWIALHKTFRADPAEMQNVLASEKVPVVRHTAAKLLRVGDSVRYMTIVEMRREKRRYARYALISAILVIVCAYLWFGSRVSTVENNSVDAVSEVVDAVLYTGYMGENGVSDTMLAAISEVDGVEKAGGCRFLQSKRASERVFSLVVPAEKAMFSTASENYYNRAYDKYGGNYKEKTLNGLYLKPVPIFVCDRAVCEMIASSLEEEAYAGNLMSIFDATEKVAIVDISAKDEDGSQYFRLGESIDFVDTRQWDDETDQPSENAVYNAEVVAVLDYISLPEILCGQFTLSENGAILISEETAAAWGEDTGYAYVLLQTSDDGVLSVLAEQFPRLHGVSLREERQIAENRKRASEQIDNIYAAIACVICLICSILLAYQSQRQQRKTIALIRQSGGTKQILRKRMLWQRIWQTAYSLLTVTLLILTLIFLLLHFSAITEEISAILFSTAVAALCLQFCAEIAGAIASLLLLKKMLRQDIFPELCDNT